MRAVVAGLVAAAAVASATGAASAATSVSSNWSGYAITGTTFKSVSGSWTQPTASCASSTSATTASAFWVGLGGDSDRSNALEQTGTEADCLANGTTRYYAWYELVPKASVRVAMKVSAGDRISAMVAVSGSSVTLKLTNVTTHRSFVRTLAMSAPDVSSAEWVAEAPSALTPGGTTVLPLTDFGIVAFTNSTAVSTSGHKGTISDPAWSAAGIQLVSRSGRGGGDPFGPFASYERGAAVATPSTLSSNGGGFSVSYDQADVPSQPQGP